MKELKSGNDWNECLAASVAQPVFLFKHSTTCSVSSGAFSEVAAYEGQQDGLPVFLVKVIEARPVSNAIAAATGVTHKSPQLLLLRDGAAIWNASHFAVTAEAMRKAAAAAGLK